MLPADWSISPTPETPLPFTNLRPFVPESWVIGSILLPSCARLPIRKLTLGKAHARLRSPSIYRIQIESTQITGTRPRRTCVYLGRRWPCCEWPPGAPNAVSPSLVSELAPNSHPMPNVCQVSGSRNKQSQQNLPACQQLAGLRREKHLGTNDLTICHSC